MFVTPDEFGGTRNVLARKVGGRSNPFATAGLLYAGLAGPLLGVEVSGQSPKEPTRIGPEALRLSKSDLAEISTQAAAEGKGVWLLPVPPLRCFRKLGTSTLTSSRTQA